MQSIKMTVDEVRGIIRTKLGVRLDMLDVFENADGQLDASLRAGPGWTPKRNGEVKQLARALRLHYRLH